MINLTGDTTMKTTKNLGSESKEDHLNNQNQKTNLTESEKNALTKKVILNIKSKNESFGHCISEGDLTTRITNILELHNLKNNTHFLAKALGLENLELLKKSINLYRNNLPPKC